MDKKKRKQTQWGIVLGLGLIILAGTVGHLELGGAILPNVIRAIIGTVISVWGLVKTYQWAAVEE